MYYFNQPTKKVVNQIKKLAAQVAKDFTTVTQERELKYDLFTANVGWPIGIMTVTSGINEYGESWVNVRAERLDDMGRNNTIGVYDMTNEGISLAIGFTCGSAFWRATPYR